MKKLLQLIFFPFSNQFIFFTSGVILKRIHGIFCVKKFNNSHGFWKCLLDYSVHLNIFFHHKVQSSMGVHHAL